MPYVFTLSATVKVPGTLFIVTDTYFFLLLPHPHLLLLLLLNRECGLFWSPNSSLVLTDA